MLNSWLLLNMSITPGLVILGNAINMRHLMTGGGMTISLNNIVLLSQLLAPEIVPSFGDTQSVLKQMRKFYWQRKKYSASLNILA
jgi:squalene monooxygenase